MSPQIPDLPDPTETMQAYRDQIGRWRRLWAVTFSILVVLVGLVGLGVAEIHENNAKRDQQIADLRAISENVDAVASPEAQARQRENIAQILVQVDCNQRDALQDVVDGLQENGILNNPITVITPECKEGS